MKTRRLTVKISKIFIIVCLLFFVSFVIKIVYVGYLKKDSGIDLEAFASTRNIYSKTISAKRGTIYDISGNTLAEDVNSYTVIAYLDSKRTTNESKPEHVVDKNLTASLLAPIINMSEEKILNLLNSKDAYQVELGPGGRNITELVKDEIESLELPGIDFIKSSKRYYKMGDFASYVIGYSKKDEETGVLLGEMGLEKFYQEYLKGTDGYKKYVKDLYGYQIPNTFTETKKAEDGYDIYLTIDNNVQILLENALNELTNASEYTWATITLADAKTGAIVGSASSPSFDLNTKENITSYLTPLSQYAYEPGSTMKIFTYMAALENGEYDGNEKYDSSKAVIGDDVITDFNNQGFGTITYDLGFAYSSNVGALRLAQKLGGDKLMAYFKKLGFGSKTGIELPNEYPGKIAFKYDVEVATAAFGQGITTTPIQNIQALTSLTNDGVMLKPYLIDKIYDPNTKKVIYEGKRTEVATVATKSTTDYVKNLMRDVIYSGLTSAKYYKTDNVTLIGKTATAQIPSPKGGYLTGDYNYIRSFAGIFPYEDPKYIVYVSVKQLKGSVNNLATVVKKVVEEVANYKNITETESAMDETKIIKINNYINKNIDEVNYELSSKGLKVVIIGDGNRIIKQSPSKGNTLVNGSKIFLLTNGSNIVFESIDTWSSSEAKMYCSLIKVKCNFEGYGNVSGYSLEAKSVVTKETEVNIVLN